MLRFASLRLRSFTYALRATADRPSYAGQDTGAGCSREGVLRPIGAGRSARYELVMEN